VCSSDLAQVGLGSVHGLAAPLGAFFPIPHGAACGTLVAAATRLNIAAMRQRTPRHPALQRYARVGRLLSHSELTDESAQEELVRLLEDWTHRLRLPLLRDYGVTEADIARIVANCRGSSMKTNPIVLEDAEIAALVRARL
jgi:alcohol dehydrogenase